MRPSVEPRLDSARASGLEFPVRFPRRKWAIVLVLAASSVLSAQQAFLGFDRNDYPGDANLKTLKQTFAYAGYWLNSPPGETANSWAGHRDAVQSAGFGFLLLFNGRLYAQLRNVAHARRLGQADAQAAIGAAKREGFPTNAVIFLDQEQGGRMLAEQKAYIYAWVDGVTGGGFRAGIYCSGIPSADADKIVTAEDIRSSAGSRQITYWAINDACPPAPGCSSAQPARMPAESGVGFAEVWQFAQSPRRKDVAARCTNYNADGNCYPPGSAAQGLHVDLNSSVSADPSHARTP